MKYYAHSLEGKPPSDWQPLEEHLKNVADKAQLFADSFSAGEWAYLAGLWHDIGKYSEEFQRKLCIAEGSSAHIENQYSHVDHSTAGAQHSFILLKDRGKILSYAIAGHHAGLPDGKSNEESSLIRRLNKSIPNYSTCPKKILDIRNLESFPFVIDPKRGGFQLSFFIRMLYSCLVDADFLDTEEFMDNEKASHRKGYPTISDLYSKLTLALKEFKPDRPINKKRAEILKNCLNAADFPQGLFSLTVPTGGGKTLSSLAFAMKHAIKHGLERVIYVIPYTSIIEQNAEVFRKILGKDAVLEHHSNFEPKKEDSRSRLASENWDAPIVVTTNVQFFESLYRHRSSRCRKIHNIANSVVILDEAQMLPVPLLKPCLEVLRELSLNYKTSIVLCTATQPALSRSKTFKDGLDNVKEIVDDPKKLYADFKRVQIEQLTTISDQDLVCKLATYKQVLCIVNTRKHARRIFELIGGAEAGNYHLSALMCPVHRTKKLAEIRNALVSGETCRVISTQLIEAGVDIDFPVVFRSTAGIDSIAQAAGRCNREGKMENGGEVFVFSPEDGLPPGHFRQTAQTTTMVMQHHDDLLSLDAVNEYFSSLYWTKGEKLDEHHILNDIAEGAMKGDFPFRGVDKKFKIIADGAESIIIPWNDDAKKIIASLRYADYPMKFARKAQRFTVQVYPKVLASLQAVGSIECLHEQYYVLTNMDIYRDELGLCPENPTFHDVENLVM